MKRTKKQPQKAVKEKVKKTIKSKPKQSGVEESESVKKLVHLLQVNQVELEHQNQELRMAEAELEASRNKYVSLFDFSPLPSFALDTGGLIREVNLSAAKMFGVDRNQLIGKSMSMYIPTEERNTFHTFIKDVFDSPVKQSSKFKVISKDKRVFHVLLEGVKLDDTLESEQRCQIALIDLTEYKKLEDSFNELSGELRVLKAGRDKAIR